MSEAASTIHGTGGVDPRGRRALVTGAASGIGRACARRLAAAGAEVTVLDVNADGARRLAQELDGHALVVDLAGPDLDALRLDTDILTSSVHGLRASAFKSAYVAAKHGLEGLSKVIGPCWAAELPIGPKDGTPWT